MQQDDYQQRGNDLRRLEGAYRRQYGCGARKARTRYYEKVQDGEGRRWQRSAPYDGRTSYRVGSFGNGAGLSSEIFKRDIC